jgi:uncharacterized radical SAM superfamily Fe-S cluster-containing enzyme
MKFSPTKNNSVRQNAIYVSPTFRIVSLTFSVQENDIFSPTKCNLVSHFAYLLFNLKLLQNIFLVRQCNLYISHCFFYKKRANKHIAMIVTIFK